MFHRSLAATRTRRPVLASAVAVLSAFALASSSALAAPSIKSLGDLNVGSADGDPSSFTKYGTKILFVATDETKGREIWRTDGTPAGTKIIRDINPSGDAWPGSFFVVNGYALFEADNGGGEELWRTDGTATGTKKVKDINGDPNTGSIDGITSRYGNHLYFYADDGQHGIELWRSDGTATGTKMLKDVNPGTADSARCCVRQLGNGTVLFQADDSAHGVELWRTNGSPNGTAFVADINSGPESSFPLDGGAVAGNRYFFCAWPTSDLWVTDGTTVGTALLKEFDYCVNPHPYGNDVLVTARSVGSSVELWRSDGTPAGTEMVTDLNPTGDSNPVPLHDQPLNGKYFIAADDGSHGRELFVYDGSSLSMVEDINPSGGSGAGQTGNRRMALGNRLVFEADNGTNGFEPWITDGTESGTFLLKDIAPGAATSESYAEVVLNGFLYFAAENATYGRELWRTNGTQLGTKRVTDLNPGGGGSWPYGLTAIGGKIYFAADDGTHNFEPYRLTP